MSGGGGLGVVLVFVFAGLATTEVGGGQLVFPPDLVDGVKRVHHAQWLQDDFLHVFRIGFTANLFDEQLGEQGPSTRVFEGGTRLQDDVRS